MIIYLTSDPGGAWDENGHPKVRAFKRKNGFIKNLRKDLRKYKHESKAKDCLIIAADPKAHSSNDEHLEVFTTSFKKARIRFDSIQMCDSRSSELVNKLNRYALIFLMGGYAPTQNEFFKNIDLKDKLSSFNGILLSLSAGSMNLASTVYMLPEEAADFDIPLEARLVPGLGLTDIQLVPHYQYLCTLEFNGQNLIYDWTVNESEGRSFTGLCDDGYFIIDTEKNTTMLHGEAYHIEDKKIRPY